MFQENMVFSTSDTDTFHVRYNTMGAKKNTTEFTLTNPSKPASKGRTYAIYCAVGVDVQQVDGLSNGMAHEYLDRANNGEAYEVREELLKFEDSRAAKKDVAKQHRHQKAKSKATAKSKSESSTDETASLMALLKSRPGLLKKILAKMEAEEGETEEPKAKPKATPKAKPKAATSKKKGTNVQTKNGANVTIADDDTISDDDLLKMLGKAMGA